MSHSRDQLLSRLLIDSHVMPLERVPARVAEHAEAAGHMEVRIYLADVQERLLRLLTGPGLRPSGLDGEHEEDELAVEGTTAGRAFQYGDILLEPDPSSDLIVWWVPLLDGAERLGALRARTAHDDLETRASLKALAALVALLVVTKRDYSDAHAWLVRSERMHVPAEMQWTLMPPRAYADDRVVIGAVMEPAYQISGDAYEYATAGDMVHLAVFDAMGHDTAAGLTANLAMAACRSRRRQGRDAQGLLEVAESVDRALALQFRGDSYVTAILADLDTRTGQLTWTSHGHQPPVLIRGGHRTMELECSPAPPLGTDFGVGAELCQDTLQPGDRIVFYTDGVTEAGSPRSSEFGLARFLDFLICRQEEKLSVPETLRRLVREILRFHNHSLADDATVVLAEWNGPAAYRTEELETLVGLPPTHSDRLRH